MNSNYKRYKMLVFDLDGTLLNSHHKISPLTRKVLYLLKNDFKILVATGRRKDEIKDVHKQLKDIEIDDNYIVTANGAEVFLKDSLIFRYKLDYGLVKKILQIQKPNIENNLYTLNDWYSDKDVNSPIMRHFIEDLGLKPIVNDLFSLSIDSVTKLVYYSARVPLLEELKNEILMQNFEGIHVFFSSENLLEVTNVNANKYNAIRNVALFEQVALRDILVFGDNSNDYEMLKNLGKGVVMKNANEFIKTNLKTNEMTKFTNNEDGVARFLIDFFELNIT